MARDQVARRRRRRLLGRELHERLDAGVEHALEVARLADVAHPERVRQNLVHEPFPRPHCTKAPTPPGDNRHGRRIRRMRGLALAWLIFSCA